MQERSTFGMAVLITKQEFDGEPDKTKLTFNIIPYNYISQDTSFDDEKNDDGIHGSHEFKPFII